MLGPLSLFGNGERAAVKRLSRGVVAHGLKQAPQIVQAGARAGMPRPFSLFSDRERAAEKRLGGGIVAHFREQSCHRIEVVACV